MFKKFLIAVLSLCLLAPFSWGKICWVDGVDTFPESCAGGSCKRPLASENSNKCLSRQACDMIMKVDGGEWACIPNDCGGDYRKYERLWASGVSKLFDSGIFPSKNEIYPSVYYSVCVPKKDQPGGCIDGYLLWISPGTGNWTCIPEDQCHWVKSKGKCVEGCRLGHYIDGDKHVCINECNGYVVPGKCNHTTGLCQNTCEKKCPSHSPYYISGMSLGQYIKECVQKCFPGQSVMANQRHHCVSCNKSNEYQYQDLYYGRLCYTTSCPDTTVGNRAGGHKRLVTYKNSDGKNVCVPNCPTGQYRVPHDPNSRQAAQTCTSCHNGYVSEGTCYRGACPAKTYWYKQRHIGSVQFCAPVCPSPNIVYTENGGSVCSKECPDGKYYDVSKKQCVSECTGAYKYVGSGIKKCVSSLKCSQLGYKISEDGVSCVSSCPKYISFDGKSCVANCQGKYYPQIGNQCLGSCTPPKVIYTDASGRKTCAQNCSEYNQYRQEHGNICISCANGYTFRGVCYGACPDNTYWDKRSTGSLNSCVLECPSPNIVYTTQNGVAICNNRCPGEEYYDASKKKCSSECTGAYKYVGSGIKKCVSSLQCSQLGYKISEDGASCVQSCAKGIFDYNGRCVRQCPSPNIAYTKNGVSICSKECSGGKYYDAPRKLCSDCSQVGLYKSAGPGIKKCVTQCKYYPETGKQCLGSCPPPKLQYKASGRETCAQNCPEGLYQNGYKCVQSCDNKFIDSTGKKCVSVCKPERISLDREKCVMKCPSTEFNDAGSCKSGCPKLSINKNGEKTCVLSCPPRLNDQKVYHDVDNKRCVLLKDCPKAAGKPHTYVYKDSCYKHPPSQAPYCRVHRSERGASFCQKQRPMMETGF